MAWCLPGDVEVLSGPMADLFVASLACVYDMMLEEVVDGTEQWYFKIPVFDRLPWPQRLALLVEVAEALLRPEIKAPELTAVREAAVAAIAQNVDDQLAIETDGDFAGEGSPWEFYWRRLVRAIVPEPDDEPYGPIAPELANENLKDWLFITECCFWGALLWDEDWRDDEVQDVNPTTAVLIRGQLGIDADYYTSVAPDPRPDEMIPLVRRMDVLIAQVSKDDRHAFLPGFVPESFGFD
jgi:hypothetical protein